MTRLSVLIAITMSLIAALTGCLGPPPVLASSEVTRAAINLEEPPADRARVFAFTGRGPLFSGGGKATTSHILPADIYVNNVKIGTVNPKEAMVFDVAPGRYSFSWMIYNQRVGWGEEMRPGIFELPGGVIVGISAEYVGGTYFISEGVMTSLFDKSGQKRLSPDVKIVRAVHCPPTICI
ncbi:MAG: hypothetical protein Q8N31_02635 [Reyranella sp.]|nr:hypothetical protein [Reyranella sp.]MDP3158885.1 hypothetical protein [Reyranella sp.]